MTEKEAGQLLVMIRDCIPNFQPSPTAPKTWKRILGNMTYTEAERHMDAHFRDSRFAPTPFDIINRSKMEFNPDRLQPLEPPDDMRGESNNANRLRNRD